MSVEVQAYLSKAFRSKDNAYLRVGTRNIGPISLPDLGQEISQATQGTRWIFDSQNTEGIIVKRNDRIEILVRRTHTIPDCLDTLSIEKR